MTGNRCAMLPMFAAAGALLALAPGKLPFFAVSAATPLFGWILVEAAAARALRLPPRWVVLAGLFWLALFCSLGANVVAGGLGSVGAQELTLAARYAFWMAVFVGAAALTANARWTPRLTAWLGTTAVALALMRLADAAWGGSEWLHQNEYGLRFSAFTPFLLAAFLAGRTSLARGAAAALTAAAILGNGSRACWIALAVSAAGLSLLRFAAGRRLNGPTLALTLAPALLAALAWLGPREWSHPVRQRWESFASLGTDKPFQTRLALIEKGGRLFLEHPVFGVGLGRFDRERVKLAGVRTPWTNDTELNQRSSHNSYVSLLAETGLIGSLPFAAILALLLVGGARAAMRLVRRGEEWAGGVWASALAVSVHLWALAGLSGTLPWFVFGLTAGVIERARRGASA